MPFTDRVVTARARELLQLILLPGLGSVRASGLLDEFGGSADRVLGASHAAWCAVHGIGRVTSEKARAGIPGVLGLVEEELDRMESAGVRGIAIGDPGYPSLLEELPDAPRLLFFRGSFGPSDGEPTRDAYPVAIVGSRRCTQYGIEQAERFAGVLGRSGLTIVSGGARGIDTASHRGALRSGGRTVVVQGCGLGRAYPPENSDLFERIVSDGAGAIVSELPMLTVAQGKHFPARNRIISGLSLGVIVIEAGRKSGALITAGMAVESHGREVMVLPGRVDSESIAGSLGLLKRGCGAMVTEPGDVLEILEAPARFAHAGTHGDRYADPAAEPGLGAGLMSQNEDAEAVLRAIAAAGIGGGSLDGLHRATGLEVSRLRTAMTLLEISGRVKRVSGLFVLAK